MPCPVSVTSLTEIQIRGIWEGIYTKWNNRVMTVAVPTTPATPTCTLSPTGVGSVTITSGATATAIGKAIALSKSPESTALRSQNVG